MTRRIVVGLLSLATSLIMVSVSAVLPIAAVLAESTTDPTTTATTTTTSDPQASTTTDPAPADTATPTTDTAATPAPLTTDPAATTATTSPTLTDTTTGPISPTGPAADTYVYNETTGLWENDHYTWDPVTKQTKPKDPVDYSYNPTTGRWDTTQWVYNPESGNYQENVITTPTPQLSPEQEQAINSLPDTQGALLRALLLPSSQQGPGATSTINNQSTGTGFFDLFHNATISNTLDSKAVTGNALVASNTLGGSATSGNAQAITNLFNILNSSIGFLSGSNPLLFTANILGNILGDLLIDPGQLPASSAQSQQQNTDSSLKVQSQNTGTINNDISLLANSGAATVANNTQAGSATSGNAYAMANVMNTINSVIGSGQSFMGMVNIYGNLNGDILLPPGFMNSLLASNAQTSQTPVAVTDPYNTTLQNNTSTTANINLNDTNAINNNLNVTAASGNSLVSDNTSAGNATTGSANTNVTLLNLTGKQIVGKNALLVFVNVLGSWVGLIMNAPNGVTSGIIGDSSATIASSSAQNTSLDVNSKTKNTINNNLLVDAKSGDASVINNTSAGNATSGNALAAVNVLNMSNSAFSLSDWFGILFINVLGNWYGSFGVDTAAGNPINTPSPIPGASNTPQVFSFVPSSKATTSRSNANATQGQQETTAVLGATSNNDSNGSKVLAAQVSNQRNKGMSIPWLLFAVSLILIILFGDRTLSFITHLRLGRA